MKHNTVAVGLIMILYSAGWGLSHLAAQETPDTVRLEELVVTATRFPVSRASVASAVTVISAEELKSRGVRYVWEALRTALGASVVQVGSFGGITSLFLRGGESDYVSVLLDGIPLNQPGGSIDLADLTVDEIDRIEIVRGPASVLYGSDAMTGVVQIFTAGGRVPQEAEAGARAGVFQSARWGPDGVVRGENTNTAWEWYWRWRGSAERVAYNFALSRASSEGIYTTDGASRFNNDYRNTVVNASVRTAPDERTDIVLNVRYGDNRYHFPTDGAGRLADRNQFSRESDVAAGIELGRYLTPRLEARLQLATHMANLGNDDPQDSPADTVGFYSFESHSTVERRRADLRANWHLLGGAVLTAGALLEEQRQRGFSASQSQFGASAEDTDLKRSTRAYYGQLQADLVRALAVNAGARLEDNETFGTFVTFRGGLVYRAPGSLRLRVAAGTGFKEPTFFENFATGFVRGNPELDPERSTSWEIGLERAFLDGQIRVAGTYFSQRFRDLIQFTFSPPSPSDPNWFNVAAADASGIEVELEAVPLPGASLEAGYTYLRTVVRDAGFDTGPGAAFQEGRPLLRRPAHSAFASLVVRPGGSLSGSVVARYVGERDDLDFSSFPAERRTMDPYMTADVAVEFGVLQLARSFELGFTGRVENVLDSEVREAFNFPARGRTLWVGLRMGL
ncbi:MAG: TonB-dependent receptor [Gemmatimonadales bacterium]|nr:MAG: TonB-dependent receptor [Gemmatimonadales bacterium]